MVDLPEGARDYLRYMRSLSTDNEGREVRVGLTHDETADYHAFLGVVSKGRTQFAGSSQEYDKISERYLALHDKHELARRQVLVAEWNCRTITPLETECRRRRDCAVKVAVRP